MDSPTNGHAFLAVTETADAASDGVLERHTAKASCIGSGRAATQDARYG